MKRDTRGVGGFLEDMPVLIFVLAGVVTLIWSSVWSVGVRSEIESMAELDRISQELLDRVVWELCRSGCGQASVDGISALNESLLLPPGMPATGWAVSVEVIHPWKESLAFVRSDAPQGGIIDVGGSWGLLNAEYGNDGNAILRVVCLVWH